MTTVLRLCCLIILVSVLRLSAQDAPGYFEYLTSENGLTENHVNAIHQDKQGYLWFGTFDGLNRYDGYEVVTYKPDPNRSNTLSGLLIFAMSSDLHGNIWIGTTGTGLNRFDPLTNTFEYFGPDDGRQNSLVSNTVQSMLTDSRNRLLVGTDKGLSILDLNGSDAAQRTSFTNYEVNGLNLRIETIFEDRDGTIWLGTDRGLYKMIESNGDGVQFVRIAIPTIASDQNTINDITQTADGQLVIGGTSGLYYQLRSPGNIEFAKVGYLPVTSMVLDTTTDHLWVGTSQGLQAFTAGEFGEAPRSVMHFTNVTSDRRSLSNNNITEVYLDHSGILWIGTFGGGVNKFDPRGKRFFQLQHTDQPTSLSNNGVRAVYQDRSGGVWVGTVGGGVNYSPTSLQPGKEANFTVLDPPKRVYSILEINNASGHKVLLGSDSGPGLFEVDLNEPTLTARPNRSVDRAIFSMIEANDGTIWLGSYAGGLYRWVPQSDGTYDKTVFRSNGSGTSLPSDIVRSLLEDRSGNLWIGTGDGLARISADSVQLDNPSFRVFRNIPGEVSSLSHNYILPLFEASNGDIWIGTFGGGLNRYVPGSEGKTDHFVHITERGGLRSGVIKAILEDSRGHLWLSSNKGITRYDPRSSDLINFDYSDGLQSNEFQELAAVRQHDGTMIFGGVNGINLFDPGTITPNTVEARPIITELSIGNETVGINDTLNGRVLLTQSISHTDRLNLTYRENSLSLKFAGLHFASPGKNRYAYRLVGFDDDWIYTTADQRSATYTNLPYDDYTFEVKAANSDGIWQDAPATLDISIAPPFYATHFAFVLYGLAFLGLLYAIRRYSIIDAEEKNRLLIKRVSQEKTEELNQLKLQFFTNISHEFRTPLTLITSPLESLIQSGENIPPLRRDQFYHLMYKNSKYLLRLVDQLLDFRRLDQGQMPLQVSKRDIVEFVSEATAPFEFLATKKNVAFSIEAEESPITTWFDPDVLEKVLFNLLSNAFKFTPTGGRVQLNIRKTNSEDPHFKTHLDTYGAVCISVANTGPGLSRKQLTRIFDRFYKSTAEGLQNREGAGIGLAFTKTLVDLHHGYINAESEVGEETVFHVRLALDKNHYKKSEIAQQSTVNYVPQSDPIDYFMPDENLGEEELNALQINKLPAAHRQDDDESPLLLYIDDNSDLRNFIRQGFANDFRVIAADGGAAGIELAKTSLPDIVISDVMMPEVDGMQVLEALKNDPRTSHIPVIMLTAKDTEESVAEGLGYGADGYVTKPFNLELLRQQIINIVNYREALRARFRQEVITSPKEVTVTNADEEFLQQAMDIVEENMSNTDFTVEQLVREMSVSRSKLYLKLKALTGQSSSEFVRTIRLKRAVQLLEDSNYSVKEVMFMTGFNTASYFSKCFKQQFGIVPSEYMKKKREDAEV
ncbi:signal transduction histidine kinase/ligand-binding sensor domain-containing protein/DNA-binding response OmpR family regulator [Lewinella aquimaris]|uniref:histidine kinase n=1 Tax=Neolewinella aquimaris TaxID=1835722 RepID=A0A840E054_9BACT|nr:two-component regulator propeller domain-containing protein [Neolewinella aquimaris]MBB4078611.1 signal transduction histidine kinase/ligand-binding sensor domain-containing protein/DNA-binding response OmpR family regulator [Neolewinella aquimaris]